MAESATGPRLSTRPLTRRSRKRRVFRFAVRAVEFLVIVALIGAAALAIRLTSGPIYLEALQERIAASLQERTSGRYTVALGPVSLMHDSWGVALGFDGLTVRDRGNRPVISSPAGRMSLDVPALMLGQVRVQRLQLEGLDVRLHVDKDGALSLAVSGDAGAAPIALPAGPSTGLESTNLATLVRSGVGAMAAVGEAIDHVVITNGLFQIENEATGRSAAYKDFRLAFDRAGAESTASLSARGPAGNWALAVRARAGDDPTLAIEARDISLADIETFDKKPPPIFVEGPIGFRIEAGLAPDQTIQALDGAFTLGAGQVRLNNPDALPFLVDEASGRVAWDNAEKRLTIEGLSILAGETHLDAHGWVSPPAGAADPWTVRLESANTRFGAERPGMKPVALDAVMFTARAYPLESRFAVDEFSARGQTVDIGLNAEVAPEGPDAVSLKLNLTVGPSVSADVIRLWPQFINPDVRDWCSHNLHGGQISGVLTANWSAADLDAMNHKRAVRREAVRGTISGRDVGVDLLPGLPMMTASEISGAFTGRDFSISAKSASMILTPTRRIQATNVVFTIPDTSPRELTDAQASAHLAGGADSLADLLNREPLRKQAGLVLDPATVHGQAEGDLTLALKLGRTAKPEDSQFHATGTAGNLTMEKFVGDEKFDTATLAFDADRNTLKMTGEGQVFGVPAHLEASRAPGDDGQAVLVFTLDPATLAKRGLAFPWLTGSLPVKMKAPLSRTSAAVEIDLTQAAIANPVPGLAKSAGKPGKLSFQAKPAPNGAALTDLAIDFGTAAIRGSAELGPDGGLASAKLAQVRISPGDSLQADLAWPKDGGVKASVRGATLDARPALKALGEPGAGGGNVDVDLKVGAATGANKQTIGGLEMALSLRAGEVQALQARGRIGEGAFTAARGADGDIRIASSDAGAFARFADIYSRMEGGALAMSVAREGGSTTGAATITNFVLRDEPALGKLVAAAPERPDGGIDPTRVSFQRMSMNFERSQGVLDVRDAVIYNPVMGLTAGGRINFPGNSMDLSGTFIPAYAVNNMLNKIPVLGELLGGGSNEGLIGISYRVRGAIDSPSVSVNPLSAIAPGILRKIIGGMGGGAPDKAPPEAAARRPNGRQ